ncbi:DUF4845 domain-containing protein [Thiohalocapsa marina]|uniref:DUF4845 domain-containing protein n=1 Tax=Thiohalocapsa marina TaxID=424902 RepID=A0A5M8FLE2_9GAMM|nr:DUF4845 domain-containing protein [Thiohalocapsa marina]KAA6185753.1 DUF4845 domain-containing protein [Thiohalocapsa marina]
MIRKQTIHGQRGAGLGGVLIVLALILFFASVAIKTLPAYVAYWHVRSAMQAMQERPDLIQAGPAAVLDGIARQLSIDGVEGVDRDAFEVQRTPAGFDLLLAYEVRRHLVYNLDLVLSFSHQEAFDRP